MTDIRKQLLIRSGILILVVLAIYGSCLTHGFVWDDNDIIVRNPLLEKLANIPRFFLTEDAIEDATGYYRPVTYISFALDRALWGVNPAGFHVTNLILHCAVVLLLFRVIAALFDQEWLAFVAALLFALHPITVETVNFLSGGRNTLLSAAFMLLSLLCYVRKKRIVAAVFFAVAIFSKEFALLLPVILVLYDSRLQRDKNPYLNYVPYLAIIGCYLVLRSFAVQHANFFAAFNPFHILSAPYLVLRYAVNMILPVQLGVMYDIHPRLPMLIVGMVAGVLLAVAIYLVRKKNEVFLSLCWFLLFLLPVINIVPINSTALMADRYAYFSLMGFALLLATLICRMNERLGMTALLLVCGTYAVIDFKSIPVWRDEAALFSRMTQDAPRKFIGFRNLGLYYYQKGDVERAVASLEAADGKSDNTGMYLVGDAYIFWKENRLDTAIKALLQAQKLNSANTETNLLLAILYEQKGDLAAAARYRERFKEQVGDVDKVMADRVVELCRMGEKALARQQYLRAEIYLWQALKINPSYIPALIDMGSLNAEKGDLAQAIQYFQKALSFDPANASAHYNLATVYRMQGRSADAQQEMNRYQQATGSQQPGSLESGAQ